MLQFGWHDLSIREACNLDLPQAVRVKYQAFMIGIFGVGFTIAVRPKP